mmetsp:Transcript_1057/g.1758  ORF Transcript_1057/g.1758 Transcript_1057/m.1758 type:complete len:122 (+) Transcript_1057:154-519(+)
MAAQYHPKRSQVSDEQLARFLISPITGAVDEVPGVGPVAKRKLAEAEDNIQTTHQLLGKFLSFKGKETDCIEHLEEFNHWLETIGISRYGRVGIVRSIAEKANTMMPGIYEGSLYPDDDET